MRRCVIIGGAGIHAPAAVREYLRADDFNIFCDCGLRHADALGIAPHLIVGDFDSHPRPVTDTETIVLPCEKDDTDTVYAVREAVKRGFDDFLLVGMIGERLDHTLGNLSILLGLDSRGKRALIVDDYSEIEVVSRRPAFISDRFSYFSLLAAGGAARGINIENAKYPLRDGVITSEYQYGISNEVPSGCTSKVTVDEGRLLLVRIRRDSQSAEPAS